MLAAVRALVFNVARITKVALIAWSARSIVFAVVVASTVCARVVVAAKPPAAAPARRVALVMLVSPDRAAPALVAPIVFAPARIARVKIVVPFAAMSRHSRPSRKLSRTTTRKKLHERVRRKRATPNVFNFIRVEGNLGLIILA
jgi:hypothetical protein